ncbi:MAG: DUF3035 domain-containing protein [Sphingomonadaceae bacterium]
MTRAVVLLGLASFLLAACGSSGIANRKRPDEFAVGRAAPLVIPPDFNMAPPAPGSPRPLAADSQQQALEALFGPGVTLPPPSATERDMLETSRASAADPMIRNYAGELKGAEQRTMTVDKGVFLRELLDAPPLVRNPSVARIAIPGA